MTQALFYDGESARPRGVSLTFAEEGLEIRDGATVIARWPYERIRERESASPNLLRLALTDRASLARLEVTDPDARDETRQRCRTLADPREDGRAGPIVAWSAAAAASLVACVLFLVPLAADRATPLIPVSLERRLGTAVDNQVRFVLGGKTCNAERGRAALDRLVRSLTGKVPHAVEPDIRVLDSPLANAVALPGGRIYLFRGLLDEAESADEIGGVLAHEMGHVAHRDGLRKLLQTGGASFLLGLLFGDVAGSGTIILLGRLAVDGAYSRDAERGADRFAADTMRALGRSPKAMALLLKRIAPEEGPVPAFFSSHPITRERLDSLPEPSEALGEPLLTSSEWLALKSICKTG
jgi:Zn-dependent protease with chaperone function